MRAGRFRDWCNGPVSPSASSGRPSPLPLSHPGEGFFQRLVLCGCAFVWQRPGILECCMTTEQRRFARQLRRQSTKPEDVLWSLLRANRLDGLKSRRQVPLLSYTVDFLCVDRKLVIELDGRQHDGEREYDAARTQEIERHGFVLIRFTNDLVLNDRDAVIAGIREAAGTSTQNPLL